MIDGADKFYRVQISAARFNVSYEVRPEHQDEAAYDAELASLAITGALAMASYDLPRLTQILAHVVSDLVSRERERVPHEACDMKAVRQAEDAFHHAADRLRFEWGKHDAQRIKERAS
ncbi:MAG: hypothetical protein LC135_03260 [Phycisphaerae bacterium]|nr:hypothetical protein [Phycisphaerae bacterium]MCZ2398873.1 hypothetical protein [Phycisphaerae bacterium]NUQ49704.1 hypothetical protein [Phycisphaerae bacterium]